jgi:hypothetical protein
MTTLLAWGLREGDQCLVESIPNEPFEVIRAVESSTPPSLQTVGLKSTIKGKTLWINSHCVVTLISDFGYVDR